MAKNKYDEALLKTLYVDQQLSVEEIAEQTGLPLRGLRSKLGSMGIYVKKTYLSKTGEKPVRKRDLIDKLIPILQITPEEGDTLEKVTKRVLQRMIITYEKLSVDGQDK